MVWYTKFGASSKFQNHWVFSFFIVYLDSERISNPFEVDNLAVAFVDAMVWVS